MLEEWLKIAEREKEEAINGVRAVCTDATMLRTALNEIEIDYKGLVMHLRIASEIRFKLSFDLLRIEKYYDMKNNSFYRELVNHIENHILRIRHLADDIRKGEFDPIYD